MVPATSSQAPYPTVVAFSDWLCLESWTQLLPRSSKCSFQGSVSSQPCSRSLKRNNPIVHCRQIYKRILEYDSFSMKCFHSHLSSTPKSSRNQMLLICCFFSFQASFKPHFSQFICVISNYRDDLC